MEEPSKATKKPRSKLSLAAPVKTDATPLKWKVGSEKNSKKESKRVKRKLADLDEGTTEETPKKTLDDSKKQLFQRLWSEEDEIVILKGMTEYAAKKGAEPMADISAFHEFLKKSLHIDVSNAQLLDKVRRMKKKYENNVRKRKDGKDRTFSNPHEQNAYELSKKIWGDEANGVANDSTKVNGKAKNNQNPRVSVASPEADELGSPDRENKATKKETSLNTGMPMSLQFNRSTSALCSEEKIIEDGWGMISSPKKLELVEKWKKLRVEEIELFLKQVDLVYEQTKLVLEAFKSSGN